MYFRQNQWRVNENLGGGRDAPEGGGIKPPTPPTNRALPLGVYVGQKSLVFPRLNEMKIEK